MRASRRQTRFGRWPLDRILLLWLLGTVVLTVILTSALVLRHEQLFLRTELTNRARALARALATAAAEDRNPARVPLAGLPELRAAEVRDAAGRVPWRFGEPGAEGQAGAGFVTVDEPSAGGSGRYSARVTVSTARVRWHVLSSGLRLVVGLSLALAATFLLAAVVAGRITRPLEMLAARMGAFQPDQGAPEEVPPEGPREVRELGLAFSAMAERLIEQRRALMEAVATLAGGVAHDFNNLLTGVLLHLRLLERGEGGEEELGAIRRLAEEGVDVVQELLLFARRETTPPRVVDLARLVRDQAPLLHHLVPAGVALGFEVTAGPLPVTGSPVALRRLLLNLVLNARDAVEPPRGAVEVKVIRAEERAVVRVKDNGSGIPSELREHLFEPFFTRRREGRGAGLGLAVVYAVVREHGGEITVDSAPGEGTCMTVRLPLRSGNEMEESGAPQETTVRALLVERDGRLAAQRLELLAEAGLEVRHASSVADAEKQLGGWKPNLVFANEGGLTSEEVGRLSGEGMTLLVLVDRPGGPDEEPISKSGKARGHLLRAEWPNEVGALRRLIERSSGEPLPSPRGPGRGGPGSGED